MKTETITYAKRSVLLSLLVLGMTCAVPIASASPGAYESPSTAKAIQSNTSKNAPSTHTLVIKTTGPPVTYTVSASKKISISSAKNESLDSSRKTRVTGRLGGIKGKNTKKKKNMKNTEKKRTVKKNNNKNSKNKGNNIKKKKKKDTTDVVTYRGYIKSLDLGNNSKNVRVLLDGKSVPPEVLTANHIRISSPKTVSGNKSQSARYRIPVSGRAVKGESTEKQDKVKAGTIRGRINGDSDSFYFTGSSGSLSFDGEVVVFINGQKLSGSQNNASPPTPQTGSSPVTDSKQKTQLGGDTMGNNPTTETTVTGDSMVENTDTPNGSSSNGGSGSSAGNGFLYGLAGGFLVMGSLGFAVIKYLRPRQRRW